MVKVKRLNYNRAVKIALLLVIPTAAILVPMDWIEGAGPKICIWHNITGYECYGCGITRAVVSVMKLRFAQAWGYNHLVVAVFPILLWLWGRELFRLITDQ